MTGSQTLGFYIKEASTVHVQINISKALLLQQLSGEFCSSFGRLAVGSLLFVLRDRRKWRDLARIQVSPGSKLHCISKQKAEVEASIFLRKVRPGLLNGRCLSVTELGDLYCYRWGQHMSSDYSGDGISIRSTLRTIECGWNPELEGGWSLSSSSYNIILHPIIIWSISTYPINKNCNKIIIYI